MLRAITHLILHVAVPASIARICYGRIFVQAFLVMMAAMLIDVDHLLANPVYDAARCSIGFHPLHTYPLITLYLLLALIPKSRIVGIGLVVHILLDGVDCIWINYET